MLSAQVYEIVTKAWDINEGNQRRLFVDEACTGDASVRAAVREQMMGTVYELVRERRTLRARMARLTTYADWDSELYEMTRKRLEDDDYLLPTVINNYELFGELGRGGMGVVYLARQSGVQRPVAIKFMARSLVIGDALDSFRKRLEMESRALARLASADVSRLIDFGEYRGRQYLVMEYVRGQPAKQYCDSSMCSLEHRLVLVEEICAIAHYAHERGVVHRDIKPSNILVTSRGPVIIDWGLAALVGSKTRPGGTSLYAAPEQLKEDVDVVPTMDVYGIGTVFYELCTGHPPHGGSDTNIANVLEYHQVVNSTIPKRPSRIAGVLKTAHRSADLDAIVMKSLRIRPSDRYQSALALAIDIARYRNCRPVEARSECMGLATRIAYELWRGVGRRRYLSGVAFLIVITLMAFATQLLVEREARRDALAKAVVESARQQATKDLAIRVSLLSTGLWNIIDAYGGISDAAKEKLARAWIIGLEKMIPSLAAVFGEGPNRTIQEARRRPPEGTKGYLAQLPELRQAITLAERSLGKNSDQSILAMTNLIEAAECAALEVSTDTEKLDLQREILECSERCLEAIGEDPVLRDKTSWSEDHKLNIALAGKEAAEDWRNFLDSAGKLYGGAIEDFRPLPMVGALATVAMVVARTSSDGAAKERMVGKALHCMEKQCPKNNRWRGLLKEAIADIWSDKASTADPAEAIRLRLAACNEITNAVHLAQEEWGMWHAKTLGLVAKDLEMRAHAIAGLNGEEKVIVARRLMIDTQRALAVSLAARLLAEDGVDSINIEMLRSVEAKVHKVSELVRLEIR